MSMSDERCAVCAATQGLKGVVVAGRPLLLCPTHRDRLGDHQPESFDDLASFFAHPDFDRRRHGERRRRMRRQFPPRPEGRRHNQGRRAGDPQG
jgi:hypothetical protein